MIYHPGQIMSRRSCPGGFLQEIVTIKANIDTLLGYTEPGRKQEKER